MSEAFDKKFVYQVARLRVHELSLFNAQTLQNFASAKDSKELLSLLKEKNWGYDGDKNVSDVLTSERKKLWSLIDEMVNDKSIFDVFRIKNDYNNIKAALKESLNDEIYEHIYIEETTLDIDKIRKSIKEKTYNLLPEDLIKPVAEAHEVILRLGDAQLSDLIIDRACLKAIMKAKAKASDEFLKMYAELTVASADIKIAYRSIKTGKDKKFMDESIVECDTLDKGKLIETALKGLDAFYDYLKKTNYSESVSMLMTSPLQFERWCSNIIVKRMKEELRNSFGIGPIAAYILARENEIHNVKVIAAGIENGLPMDNISERLCDTYV